MNQPLQEAREAMDKAILGTPALKAVDMRLLQVWMEKHGVSVSLLDGMVVFQSSEPRKDGTTFTLYATCPGTDEEHNEEEAFICVLVGSVP